MLLDITLFCDFNNKPILLHYDDIMTVSFPTKQARILFCESFQTKVVLLLPPMILRMRFLDNTLFSLSSYFSSIDRFLLLWFQYCCNWLNVFLDEEHGSHIAITANLLYNEELFGPIKTVILLDCDLEGDENFSGKTRWDRFLILFFFLYQFNW